MTVMVCLKLLILPIYDPDPPLHLAEGIYWWRLAGCDICPNIGWTTRSPWCQVSSCQSLILPTSSRTVICHKSSSNITNIYLFMLIFDFTNISRAISRPPTASEEWLELTCWVRERKPSDLNACFQKLKRRSWLTLAGDSSSVSFPPSWWWWKLPGLPQELTISSKHQWKPLEIIRALPSQQQTMAIFQTEAEGGTRGLRLT